GCSRWTSRRSRPTRKARRRRRCRCRRRSTSILSSSSWAPPLRATGSPPSTKVSTMETSPCAPSPYPKWSVFCDAGNLSAEEGGMDGQERREFLKSFFGALGVGALGGCAATSAAEKDVPYAQPALMPAELRKLDRVGGALKITKVETLLVKPRWLFLKIHTDAGIVGLGEPITEGRHLTCRTAIEEITPYLLGKDPRRVVHHWQAIYRHAFYRGGPILTSALSGIDQALWDIKGKAFGVPIYELLGGPTRERVRVYAHAGKPELIKQKKA